MNANQKLEQYVKNSYPQSFPQAVEKLVDFCNILLEKNKVMNLTGATTVEEVIEKHFLDCAEAYKSVDFSQKNVVDIGSGAGFPGIVLAILFEDTQFTLVDSLQKRITFLDEVIKTLNITNAKAIHARAEEFAKDNREAFDIATSRAVADMRMLAEFSLPLIKTGGQFLPMKSINVDEELSLSENAIDVLGGKFLEVIEYTIPYTDIKQRVIAIDKISETNVKYPRRFAKISNSPL